MINYDNNIEVNIIGYSLLIGRVNIFQYLHNNLKADLYLMENYLTKVNLSGLKIICENNFIDLFQYYAPLFCLMKDSLKLNQKRRLRETIELTDKKDAIIDEIDINDESTYTPLQLACNAGHIGMLKCILNFTSQRENIPKELDINHIDENTGENCALIACRTGNYNMIKFLHATRPDIFFIHNSNGENAIQILAASAKINPMGDFYQCLVYLVEKIGIDIKYNYQETLILLDYDKALNYMINELVKFGINITKEDVEKDAILRKATRKTTIVTETEGHFDMGEIFSDLKKDDESSIVGSEPSNDISFPNLFQG